jgi:hypothetical protein
VWNATIHAQKDYEMIWSVGLRGLNDYAYPNCIKDDDVSRAFPSWKRSTLTEIYLSRLFLSQN